MNIFMMLKWIRGNDESVGQRYTFTADFLMDRHIKGLMRSYDLFECYKQIMGLIIEEAVYK